MYRVLNITLFDKPIPSLVMEIINTIKISPRENRLVSASGAHGIVTAARDKKFKAILDSFYINLPDGMPAVWIGRLKGAREMVRCYGPDVFKDVIIGTKNFSTRHYLCGGKPGVAEDLKRVCKEKFNNSCVVGTYTPPFREMTDEELRELAEDINNRGTDIVWIGLSTPKQEVFAKNLSRYTDVHFIMTIGAAFDIHTEKIKQAPKWIQKAGLEWLFRLLMEPRRLWKRYFKVVPLFIYYNIREYYTYIYAKLFSV